MDAEAPKPLPAFGFLTVLEDPSHGVFGGYLVITHHGRPLEFRCSTPVAPSRAQEILYGKSLRPYLLGELVGKGLVDSAQTLVSAILTDQPEMLGVALCRPEEVVFVDPHDEGAFRTSRPSGDPSGKGDQFPTLDSEAPTVADNLPPVTSGEAAPIASERPDAARAVRGKVRLGPSFAANGCALYLAPTSLSRPEKVAQLLAPLLAEVDPWEPFQRIRAALYEAGNLAGNPSGSDDERAAA